jgi:hypothetical protein
MMEKCASLTTFECILELWLPLELVTLGSMVPLATTGAMSFVVVVE